MTAGSDERLIEYLSRFVTRERMEQMERVLAWRTRALTVVLEGIYQNHNISASIRSCECFGVQDIHIIENEAPFEINRPIAAGSMNWVNLFRYSGSGNSIVTCLEQLRQRGYSIYVTSLSGDSIPLPEVRADQRTAFCFGNEEKGVSAEAKKFACGTVKIPMYGFTQSFNISVSVALVVSEFSRRLRKEYPSWRLSQRDRNEIMLKWLRHSIRKADQIIERWSTSGT